MVKAIIHTGKKGIQGLEYTTQTDRLPGKGEVKIRLKTAGLNHRDLILMDTRTKKEPPLVPGSDGAGIIEALGEGVNGPALGTEVIINPSIGWEKTDEVPDVPGILGGPADGTFEEAVIVPWQNAIPKPAYLSWEEAGVFSLSALTAYRALFTRGRLRPGQQVLIPGIGGGVATYAALMAAAAGAVVSVTSRSSKKRLAALELPIARAFDSGGRWTEHVKAHSMDLVLDSVGPALFGNYLEVLKPNGKIVMFGASSGNDIILPSRGVFFPQLQIIGTSMGSGEEYAAMLQFMEKHRLRPIVDRVFPFSEITAAFDRLEQGEQFGNIAVLMD